MAANKQSGRTLVATMIEKHGSYEAYRQAMRERASRGGKNGNTGGFASNVVGSDGLTGVERARAAGVKGGARSKRRKKNV